MSSCTHPNGYGVCGRGALARVNGFFRCEQHMGHAGIGDTIEPVVAPTPPPQSVARNTIRFDSWDDILRRGNDEVVRQRRERIATAAMAAIIANGVSGRCSDPDDYVAKTAVKLADRLIKELDKPPRKPRVKKVEEP